MTKLLVSAIFAATLALFSPPPVLADSPPDSPLDTMFPGMKALGSKNWNVKPNVIVQWKQMLDRFKQEQAECRPSDGCGKFKALVQSLSGLSTLEQIKKVRDAEKVLVYKKDIDTANQADYWATPFETLSTNTGDTEDYAILSYFALRAAGMPAAALRVLAVKVVSQGINAAVLAIDTTPEPLILDSRVVPALAVSMVAKEFKPQIGLNEDGWWIYTGKPQ